MRSQNVSANSDPFTVSASVLEHKYVMSINAAVPAVTPSVMRRAGMLFTMRLLPLFILALRTKLHTLSIRVPATSASIDVLSKIDHLTSQMEESAITLLDSLLKYKLKHGVNNQ